MSRSGTAVRPLRPLEGKAQRSARGIRPCRTADLPGVAALYESVVRSGRRTPAPRLAEYFERTFFDCPWADPEIPSLVYEDEGGAIVGFLGSHARRLRCDGRLLRLACGGQLVVEPEARSRAVGAMLFRSHLGGLQDATISDGANDVVRAMWRICGGEVSHLKTIGWTRILRPVQFLAGAVSRRLARPALARALGALGRPLDPLLARLAGHRIRPARPDTSAEPLTPRAILEHLPLVTQSLRCFPDYDEAFLGWLFSEMEAVRSRGSLVRALVRDAAGQPIGWYVYYRRRDISQVLQVAAKRHATGAVLDHLFRDAYDSGAAALAGRLEPQLAAALAQRRCLFGWHGGALIHARTPAILAALLSGECWLARMDGESWMGHHTEAFT